MAVLPEFNAGNFTSGTEIDNPYLPFLQGSVKSYGATFVDVESGEEESERNDEFIYYQTNEVAGVQTIILRDTAYEGDIMVEDTLDWYAQDNQGNVWYLGETVINYNYDDEGDFVGTDFDGSWEAGVDGALPGYLMKATPEFGAAYYQEYRVGEAEDEAILVRVNQTIETDLATYTNAITTLETTSLEPSVAEFKSYAPGVGLVRIEEGILPDGTAELDVQLQHEAQVGPRELPDLSELAPVGDGSKMWVTFLTELGESNSAIGVYLFDSETGDIGEGRILFNDTEDLEQGTSIAIDVPEGQSLGLFLVPDADDTGLELNDYAEGGLFFTDFLTGASASVLDGMAPVVSDSDGNFMPIRPLHAAGQAGDANFLNPVAGVQVVDLELEGTSAEVFGFEDDLAPVRAIEGTNADEMFDDAILAVSDAQLNADEIGALLDQIGISRIRGTDGDDQLQGTKEDDQLIGLEGDDFLLGRGGDDVIEASDGNDIVHGGHGDDEISGEDGEDVLRGGRGDDEIEGGDGDDRIFGGRGDDVLEGEDGDDLLYGRKGNDELWGGEGDDSLSGGAGSDQLAGGTGDDDLRGGRGDDAFIFNLTDIGADTICDFGNGDDLLVISTYTGATSFEDLVFEQVGSDAVLSLAGGQVTFENVAVASLAAGDFVFV
ncbi:hypothetical protein M3P21_20215 [Ruegeria sp. 2012CJ41-6]|uniref:Calcium-binding protein n=1 Tax=Ruegeria spongiae TaxID=2942209 RepID=A0ABT0Q7K3_9RHOB|nr:calcium-binding protein [Ruegeria spongiae]MCL6285846.1 hypothetical protein [Ruegeria spongiae]